MQSKRGGVTDNNYFPSELHQKKLIFVHI